MEGGDVKFSVGERVIINNAIEAAITKINQDADKAGEDSDRIDYLIKTDDGTIAQVPRDWLTKINKG